MRKVLPLLLFLACGAVSAQEWAEIRPVTLTIGEPTNISLNEPSVLRSGDTSIISSWRNNSVVLVAKDLAPRRLRFERQKSGPLELAITVVPKSAPAPALPPAPVPPPIRQIIRYVEPPPAWTPPVPPPIVAPPMPLVLRSQPVTSDWMAPATPHNGTMMERPADVRPMTVTMEERLIPGTAAPARVTERTVPMGATMPVDTSIFDAGLAKPAEQAIFALAMDLMNRGLYGQAIDQFRRLLTEFPNTNLREQALINVGIAYKRHAEEEEAEAIRQRDLRNSGRANEALERAVFNFGAASAAFREVIANYPNATHIPSTQLALAQSMHGLVRANFQKGGAPTDSPAVVVEYLRAIIGSSDTSVAPQARLGIARYHKDLGDARLLSRADKAATRQAYERAVSEYVAIVAQSPTSPSAEEALIDLARLFDRNLEMRRFNEAVRYYEALLAGFPASRYAEEARNRSRWIRENYL